MSARFAGRRRALKAVVASAAFGSLGGFAPGEEASARSRMGLTAYCVGIRRRSMREEDPRVDLFDPERLLSHCRAQGAGGMQVSLDGLSAERVRGLRETVERDGMYVEAIVKAPEGAADVVRFERQIRRAADAGAKAARTTIIPGRRYEYFDSLEKFREFVARGRRALELAAPVVERHRVPLAVENHKDQRDDERVALFQHIGSPFVGACVDTGNSVALLEDPVATVERLAPWAHSVHLKDQAVRPYEDGFLLGDIPLGQGFLDLKRMVEVLRRAKPEIRFSLELITRDPLKVPCLTERYWVTMPEVPAAELARALRAVRDGAARRLQYPSKLSPQDRLALEDSNVRQSLDYARRHLGL